MVILLYGECRRVSKKLPHFLDSSATTTVDF
ncbi:hypothetical protein SEETMRM10961_10935 [Salmonella enterica subsp. enterica serovar Typhimurium]|nr:hypothetical protein SEETMRM10961_10935 [Salmonella enterica subsp. enterica serovar Typhimurium]